MKHPVTTDVCPSGGWRIKFPETGHEIVSPHFSEFLSQCRVHMEINNLDTGTGWQNRVWNLVCLQNEDIRCLDSESKERGIGADDIRRFLRTMWETWKSGAVAVSQDEQNKRIDLCLQCPKRGIVACFGGCSQMAQALAEFTIGRKIQKHPEIHKQSCLACGCPLESKTLFPTSVLKSVDEKMGQTPDYWEKCWMVNESSDS